MKKFLRKLLAFFPSKLPVGVAEFQAWSEDLMDLYDTPKNDSVKFALATMILHSDASAAYKSKHSFGLQLVKSMANQVAAGMMQDLKAKQEAAIAAEKAAIVVPNESAS